ncbi:uncharacterized protein LOC105206393 [Solenopsis invicta]|uniref:uncharacterized protein LOC105206393 n=1 Tax=Solenopsis invicta TaxID=13686 RepID=UPI000595F380|nr:uncharacterized protein LOC105206393 [Solenopsis invicta]
MSSARRRSSSNPVRRYGIQRETSLTRNDQRVQPGLKPKEISTCGETSHVSRPRFRSSSSDRTRALCKKSYLKVPGMTPICQPTTTITPVRLSPKLQENIVLTNPCRLKVPLRMD